MISAIIVCIASVGRQTAPTVFDYSYSLAASHLTLVAVASKFRMPSGIIPQVRALRSAANAKRKKAAEKLRDTASGMAGVAIQPFMILGYFSETSDRVLRLPGPPTWSSL